MADDITASESARPVPPQIKTLANLPECDPTDPASLAAWFGNYGFFDHLRKVVLSCCAEIIRVQATEKLTEARLDQLAHTDDIYVHFIVQGLEGRRLWEQNVRDSLARGV